MSSASNDLDRGIHELRTRLVERGSLPADEWQYFIDRAQPLTLQPKACYLTPGDAGTGFAFVAQGLLKRYFHTYDGNVFIMSFVAEGEFVSDFSALLRGAPADIFIEAIESTQLLSWPPRFAYELRERHVCWQHFGRVLAEERYVEKAARERSLLSLSGTERWLELQKQNPAWLPRVSQRDIASYLGLTEVSLSRIRRSLRERDG